MKSIKRFLLLLAILLPIELLAYGWVQKADFGGTARHRTTALAIGNKAYFGLGHYNGAGVNVLFDDWWEFDPATNAWTQKADYLGGLCYHAAGFTIGDYGYVGTGRNELSQLVQDFYRYDPTNNSWVQIADFIGVGRRGAVAFVVNGFAYVGTGEISTGTTSSFYRYNPATDSWIVIDSFDGVDRTSAVAFAIDGYGYVGTGDIAGGASSKDFWRYNVALNQWEQLADVGDSTRLEATAFSLDGKGYIGTGADQSGGNNYKDFWEYNPATDTWTLIGEFEGTARRYLSSVTLNGYAYCGLGTNGTNFKDFWQFDRTLALIQKNLEKLDLIAYPNPSVDYVNFEMNSLKNISTENLSIELYDMYGKKLNKTAVLNGQASVVTRAWENGMYYYSLLYGDQVLKTGKLFITK